MSTTLPQGTHTCHLWHPPSDRHLVLQALETVQVLQADAWESQQLVRCKECGQLFFQDWRDVTRYFDHDGMWDHRLIPVADEAEAATLHQGSCSDRETLPAMLLTWPPEAMPPRWVNR